MAWVLAETWVQTFVKGGAVSELGNCVGSITILVASVEGATHRGW